MKPETCGVMSPPPMPCATRAAPIHSGAWAAPQTALAIVNSATPAMKTVLRLRASPRRPAGTSTMPNASAYPATTHWIVPLPASRPSRIDGRATLTMLTSSRVIAPASRQTARACQRRERSSGVSSGASVSVTRQR